MTKKSSNSQYFFFLIYDIKSNHINLVSSNSNALAVNIIMVHGAHIFCYMFFSSHHRPYRKSSSSITLLNFYKPFVLQGYIPPHTNTQYTSERVQCWKSGIAASAFPVAFSQSSFFTIVARRFAYASSWGSRESDPHSDFSLSLEKPNCAPSKQLMMMALVVVLFIAAVVVVDFFAAAFSMKNRGFCNARHGCILD